MRTRSELRWALIFSLVVAVITAVPYLLGYQLQGNDWRFTGYVFGVEDGNSYTAKMLLGADGRWLFRTPYTPYPQNGVLAFLPYMLLGKLSAPPGQHEQLIALFQLFRVLGTVLYGMATYDFLAIYLSDTRLRRLGTALGMLGGGLGWLAFVGLGGLWKSSWLGRVLPGMDLPLEFYSPETFGFIMILGLPHLAVARALLLWGLRDYLLGAPTGAGWLRRTRPGWLWFLMGLMQPLTVISGWAVLGAHLVFVFVLDRIRRGSLAGLPDLGWAYFKRAVMIGLWSAPLVIYTFLSFRLDPFLRGWEQQNRIISPPLHHYLLAFGPLLVLAVRGIKVLFKGQVLSEGGNRLPETVNQRVVGWLPLAWGFSFLPLAYAPYNLQRRLPDGIWIALLVLTLAGIEYRLGANARKWALRALVGFCFISTLLFGIGMVFGVIQPSLPLFRPAGEVHGFEALAKQNDRDALVLAAYETSNALPAWVPMRVLVGLGPESLNLEDLRERITCFYQEDCSPANRQALLDEFGVSYVWVGPAEKALGDWDPATMPELTLLYEAEGYQIFRYEAGR